MDDAQLRHAHEIDLEESVGSSDLPTSAYNSLDSFRDSDDVVLLGKRDTAEIIKKLRAYGEAKACRDDLIREADAQDVEEARIARLMGHSRTTIRHVLGRR